jgi:hypothetical protein
MGGWLRAEAGFELGENGRATPGAKGTNSIRGMMSASHPRRNCGGRGASHVWRTLRIEPMSALAQAAIAPALAHLATDPGVDVRQTRWTIVEEDESWRPYGFDCEFLSQGTFLGQPPLFRMALQQGPFESGTAFGLTLYSVCLIACSPAGAFGRGCREKLTTAEV